jgi:outer membrane protein OmpA-like peptidoglycan-associated protein
MTEKNQHGVWGIPQNLGGTVNTPFNENSPYLAPDGKTLYYSSNGHPGFGGMDVFYTVFENGTWSIPINLGAPLNSGGDDTNFSISALGMGYFSSSRQNGGDYEIFEIELPDELKPKATVVVQGIVSNSKTSNPLEAVVLIEDINSGELLSVNKSNSSSGEYLVVLPAGRNYSMSATSKGFFFYSQSFELPADTTYAEISLNIMLEPIEKGTKVVLNNIFFESGRAELKPISYVELNKAVDLLEDNPSMIIEIGGHTDAVAETSSSSSGLYDSRWY